MSDTLACNYGEEEPCLYFDDEGELCVTWMYFAKCL